MLRGRSAAKRGNRGKSAIDITAHTAQKRVQMRESTKIEMHMNDYTVSTTESVTNDMNHHY